MTSKKVGVECPRAPNFDMTGKITRSIIDFSSLYDRMGSMKIEPPLKQEEPKYPTTAKVTAMAVCAAVAVLTASCSQQKPQENGLLPGWIITDSDK